MHTVMGPTSPALDKIDFDSFLNLDVRVGTVQRVDDFPEARKPAWVLHIDFGPVIGVRKSTAQIKDFYSSGDLEGRQVVAVVNFPPRQVGPHRSEVLVLGFPDAQERIVLIGPDQPVPDGSRMS